MPLSWEVEGASGICVIRYTDPFTYTEWEELIERFLPLYSADIRVGLLSDRRAIAPPTTDFTRLVARYVTRHRAAYAGRRIAYLVQDEAAAFGMARMQELMNENGGAISKVFTSEAAARAWLAKT